jgi:hypothetical protein
MKSLIILAFLFAGSLDAQTLLGFDRRAIDCQNQWAVFQPRNGAYDYGFVYFDMAAGLTLQFKGNFMITSAGTFVQKLIIDSGNESTVKIRQEPGNVKVAVWATEIRKWAAPGDRFSTNLEKMEADLAK